MNIQVTIEGKTHIVKADGSQFIPEYTSLNKGNVGDKDKEVTRELGYFSSLGSAVNKLITESLGSEESTVTLREYIQRYENAAKEVRGLLDNANEELDGL